MKFKSILYRALPLIGILFAVLLEVLIQNHRKHPDASFHYYLALLIVFFAIFAILFAISFFSKKFSAKLEHLGAFYCGVAVFFAVLDLITAKFVLLPVLLFPSFDNVLSVFVEKQGLVIKCILYSFRLLGLGVLFGSLIGFLLGLALGFSRRTYYWINPIIKIIGPIPATAWIPIVLTTFPTTFSASVFIIALAVWFPVVMMTSTGILNIPNSYFEVGKTLGTGRLYQIFKIGLPASLPNVFQGIFYGVCSAFIALMTAEMFGAKAGIGWYINMEKEMAEYKGVYAGLILITIFCSIILAILSKLKNHFLRWQKGILKA